MSTAVADVPARPLAAAGDRPAAADPSPSVALAAGSLAWRELVRFFRQRTRVVGALVQPVLFWIVLGAGMNGAFAEPAYAREVGVDLSFQAYFLPGVAAMIVLFTAIFATISIIEDRREGFLQGVLVSPVPRAGIVLGKVLGGAAIAVIQAALFVALAPLLNAVGLAPGVGYEGTAASVLLTGAWLVLLAVGLTALGYCIAWPMESTQGFHAIMSVVLFPMWLLSGAAFPAEGGWLEYVVAANPLTYGVAGLRRAMSPALADAPASLTLPSAPVAAGVFGLFTLVCLAAAVLLTARRHPREAR